MSKKTSVLAIEERNSVGSGPSRRARREGKIPGILYAHGQNAKSFLFLENEWKKLIQHGDVHLVELKPSEGASINALVKDIQFNYLSGHTIHIDFLEVKMDEMITTSVAVQGRGIPIGITQGGVLEQVLHQIEVRCLPKDIPEFMELDISGIELEKAICIKDIKLPENVTAVDSPEQVVFHVIKLRIEEEATAATAEGVVAEGEEGAGVEPELVGGKGKKEEEGEEGEKDAKAPAKAVSKEPAKDKKK